ncbi:MAG: ferritin family protein [bacterium]
MDSVALGTPMQILEAALKKENEAYTFYASLRDHAKGALIRDLAEELCEEERRHVQLIERHIVKLKSG